MVEIKDSLGNIQLLNLPLTAFLCSRKYSSNSVLKSYDWAKSQRAAGQCIISGFHSPLEKDVFEILLKGNQPIIYALARGMLKKIPQNLEPYINAGRLLIITPFEKAIERITKDNAEIRNRLCISLAKDITVAHLTPGGQLDTLLKEANNKKVEILDK